MFREIGEKYEAITMTGTAECIGEFEVTYVETQSLESGVIVRNETARLIRLLN